jgi:hypothetical protein
MTSPHEYERPIDLGPELRLRVRLRNGDEESRPVADGLTIGRAAASDLAVDDHEANLIHARVSHAVGGGWELVGVGRSRMILENGNTTARVVLRPGLSFLIGATRVECQEIPVPAVAEAELLAAVDDSAAEASDDHPPVRMPRLIVCPSCYKDVSAVPVVARFCPKCGARLPARDGAGYLIPPEESSPLYPIYKALRDELSTKLKDESPRVASSMVILAYANAMLNLGWKYEHGRGLLRNVEEAARCYEKAGKLSEAWGR